MDLDGKSATANSQLSRDYPQPGGSWLLCHAYTPCLEEGEFTLIKAFLRSLHPPDYLLNSDFEMYAAISATTLTLILE